MPLKRTPTDPHRAALQAVIGEPGVSGLLVVVLAAGVGVLLDFQVTHLHPVFSVALVLLSVPVSLYWTIRRTLLVNQKLSPDHVRNLALAAAAGQAGCSTLVLVFLALFAGMFLDAHFNTHPIFTLGLVLLSIPVSLYAMVRLVLSMVARITPSSSGGAASGSGTGLDTKLPGSASQHPSMKEKHP
jgi:F0F1-type ATP synthase assembly protein I